MSQNMHMDYSDKILDLVKNKDRRTHMVFNNRLWDLFTQACKEDNVKPTNQIERFIIKYLEEKGQI